jgi:cell division FtsZ-interacting protein ZapD
MQLNLVKNNPIVVAAIQKNILEHISLMAQEQIQLEFSKELQQVQMLQQQAAQDPKIAQQIQMMMQKIESRKSVLVAEMTGDFMQEENKIITGMDSDPLLKLKSRELDLKAMENERKKKESEDKINLDKLRVMSNRQVADEKLEQTDDLTKLKVGVDLAKQGMKNTQIITS